jgi:hypothetical protein
VKTPTSADENPQPFERIELIEPFEHFLDTKFLKHEVTKALRHEVFFKTKANKWNLLPTF